MSRSYRKHPIEKWSDSEKSDKQNANRKFRRKNKQKDYEDENVHLHNRTREISDNWDWALDGYKNYAPNNLIAKRK